MKDISKMLGQMQEAQAKAQAMQQKVGKLQATGVAGAGAVEATVDGNKNVLQLNIDKTHIVPEEKELLQDLIIAAINLAQKAVEEKVEEAMKQQTTDMFSILPRHFFSPNDPKHRP